MADSSESTKRGPRIRYRREGQDDPEIVEFDESVDGIELLERCFKKHGMTISADSAARCDAVIKRNSDAKKPWLQTAKKRRR